MHTAHKLVRTKASIVVIALFASLLAHADGVNEPIPSFYQEAGMSPNRGYDNQHANEHIDPFSGKLQWHYVDLHLPGNGGLDLSIQRSYSSLNEILGEASPVGVGWTMHFGRVFRKATNSFCDTNARSTVNPVVELADGNRQILYPAVDGNGFITASMWKAVCRTDNGMDIYSPDGTKYEMSTMGPQLGDAVNRQNVAWVTKIIDRNGNTLNFTYGYYGPQSNWGISTITGSDGRNVTFNYCSAACSGPQGSLQSITDGTRTWQYKHSLVPGSAAPEYYFLDEVVRPDGNSWKYEYNPGRTSVSSPFGGYSLKKVTYPTGGTIQYAYSEINITPGQTLPNSTMVTQKIADGGTWTYAYTPATTPVTNLTNRLFDPDAANNDLDKTVVTGPEGVTTYLHFGYNSVSGGGVGVYLIGSLFGKAMATKVNDVLTYSQFETSSWVPGLISNQANRRPGLSIYYDTVTYRPVLSQRQISRNSIAHVTDFSNFDQYFNPQTISETGTASRTTTITYYINTAKWIINQKQTEQMDTVPGSIVRTFDSNGNVLTETRYGVKTTFTYYPTGDIATKKDARDFVTSYSDYYRGIPRAESQPEAVSISRTVSDAGNVLTETDGTLATTIFTYDGLNRLTSITHPLGNPVTVTWGPNTRTIDRGAYREVITFDGYGRESVVEHSDNGTNLIRQTFQYDQHGRKTFASYPNSAVGTAFRYDILGRQTAVYHASNPQGTSYQSARTMTYTSQSMQILNERGFTYSQEYRVYGDPNRQELLKINTPNDTMNVVITRNGLGQPLSITQGGKTRGYGYDSRYFQTSMTDPEVGTTLMERDEVGNMTSRKVGSSEKTYFTYDGRNRLVTVTYPPVNAQTNPVGTPNVTRTYYKDDKLKTIDNGIALREYTYNTNKNLTQEKLTITGQTAFVMGYAYDGNDSLDSLTYSSGRTVSYRPDAFGRATQALPYVQAVDHHPTGQVARIQFANGVETKVDFNVRQWPTKLSIAKGSTTAINSTYVYDQVSNVTSISDSVDASFNRSLSYDSFDRLTNATGSWGASGSIGYSADGNISSQQLGSSVNLNYTYDPSNRLASVSGTKSYTFSYDVYGNVSGNGINTFTYNDASAMRCSNCGLANEVTYAYDGANMRVKSTQGAVTTYFVYASNGNLLTEIVPNVSVKDYIYLHGKQVAAHQKALQ
jgi:YD repeat-containing protein